MRQPEFYAAVYGIIRNTEWKVLTIKRKDTGYLDWWYGLPAGHVEGTEELTESIQREILEEVWLHVDTAALKLIHTSHRVDKDRIYFDFFFEVLTSSWTPTNTEPDKSEGVFWISPNEEKFQSRIILERIKNGETFSEINLRS